VAMGARAAERPKAYEANMSSGCGGKEGAQGRSEGLRGRLVMRAEEG
jgi:hypothetical protein